MTLLTRNDDVTLPGTIVCLDVQTIDEPDKINPRLTRAKLRCWSAIAGRIEGGKWTRQKEKCSQLANEFWEWLNFVRQNGRPVWVFAARAGTSLTVLGFWRLMESEEFCLCRAAPPQVVEWRKRNKKRDPNRAQQGLLITNSPPTVVVFYHRTGWKVIVLDSANYFAWESAETVGNPAGEVPYVPTPTAPLANWHTYSLAKASDLRDRVSSLALWHRSTEMGRFAFTISGIALAGFRHRFMTHGIDLPDDQSVRNWQRSGFYQGRVEAFWAGRVEQGRYYPVDAEEKGSLVFDDVPPPPYHLLDARSMYGAVGVFCSLPRAAVQQGQDAINSEPPDLADPADMMATVTIDTPEHEFPVRFQGRTWFARGRFTTTLAGPELSRAVAQGVVIAWHRWQLFDLALIFRSFSEFLWEERVTLEQKGDLDGARIRKQLLARLHGKFMQRASRWENRPELFAEAPFEQWCDHSATTGKTRYFRSVGWTVQEEVEQGDAMQCFPAIAAFVTSYAREWLRSWMEIAGKRNVLYVATDSLIVTDAGRINLEKAGICGDHGIGSLRVVQSSESVAIRGTSDFQIGTKRVRGGERFFLSGSLDPHNTVVESDSLESVLFVRRGAEIQTRTREAHPREFQPGKKISAGGWLETPVILPGNQQCDDL